MCTGTTLETKSKCNSDESGLYWKSLHRKDRSVVLAQIIEDHLQLPVVKTHPEITN
jgi:hypothetical protein